MLDLETLNHHDDEAFGELERKLTEELVYHKLIKSFDEIKEMDRIEINESNYDSIKDTDTETLNTSLYMYIPFINKGVMTITHMNRLLYIHFIKNQETNIPKGIISLKIDIYAYMHNYYSKLVDFKCIITEDGVENIKCEFTNIHYGFDYYNDLIRDKSIKLRKSEELLYSKHFHNFHESRKSNKSMIYSGIMHTFLHCLMYLNNCLVKQQLEEHHYKKEGSTKKVVKKDKEHHVIEIQVPKSNILKDRIIFINGIKIKRAARNSEIKTRQGYLLITRKTAVWEVTGHYRHYKKSGKTIYIESYKKGPYRDTVEPGKTIYKVRT